MDGKEGLKIYSFYLLRPDANNHDKSADDFRLAFAGCRGRLAVPYDVHYFGYMVIGLAGSGHYANS